MKKAVESLMAANEEKVLLTSCDVTPKLFSSCLKKLALLSLFFFFIKLSFAGSEDR